MAWQNNGDGDRPNPWGNGGGGRGPSGRGSGGRGPGGRGPSGGGEPPDFEEMLRRGQDQMQRFLPGGKGPIVIAVIVAVVLWLMTGVYTVETNQQAVVLQFGKFDRTSGAGFHVHLPYPIESHIIRSVTEEQTIDIGGSDQRQNIAESLMLTGDENIVDVRFNVVWKIGNLADFEFNLVAPKTTVKDVAESVMRELVGKSELLPIITEGRDQLQQDARRIIQDTLNSYEAGIDILRVQISVSQAPVQVQDAFREVQIAEADKNTMINQATAYRNRIVPEARGEAIQMVQQAEAYRAQAMAAAQGEAARFNAIYSEYKQAKGIVRQRLYLQMMEEVLVGMQKTIINGESGVVPFLPLQEMMKNKSGGGK